MQHLFFRSAFKILFFIADFQPSDLVCFAMVYLHSFYFKFIELEPVVFNQIWNNFGRFPLKPVCLPPLSFLNCSTGL